MKFLKFICALLIGVLSVGFVSCGNDDDEPSDPSSNTSIVGTWSGYRIPQKPSEKSMTAKFYEDGTCEIWWYDNPLITTYYLSGEYTVTKKKLHIKGMYGDHGSRPFIDYDNTVNYSINNGVLKFKFDLAESILTKVD